MRVLTVLCCHDVKKAVFKVQGLYLIWNRAREVARKSEKKLDKKRHDICYCHNVEEAVFRVQGPYPNMKNTIRL